MSSDDALAARLDPGIRLATHMAATAAARDTGVPMINGERVASLSTCSTNLNPSCDFHLNQKAQAYFHHWRSPAPPKCQGDYVARRGRPPPPPHQYPTIHMDQLGVNMWPLCAAE